MLTGDKEETAIEIARECELFTHDMKIYSLCGTSNDEIVHIISNIPNILDSENTGFVVNGITLSFIFSSESLKNRFLHLALQAKSCVCCRVSPGQKMEVVKLGKNRCQCITLAIGDGANDVSMIQEAHIGIGICGKEGSQATQAAEFSFSQFSYLKHLLLHHGRLAYNRVSFFILYYFYKNFTSAFTEL